METVSREAEFDVPAQDLWDAIADDHRRAEWFGGETEIDLIPGGDGHAEVDGEMRSVRVHEVDPGRRLSFDWWDENDDASRVTFVVTPSPGGSRLTVTETRSVTPPAAPQAGTASGSVAIDAVLDLEAMLLCRTFAVRA